jgi:hypothetical protein
MSNPVSFCKINTEKKMNPCRDCLKKYGVALCMDLGHCVFEGTNEAPINKHAVDISAHLTKTSLQKRDGAISTLGAS